MAAGDGFAEAVVEGGDGGAGMEEGAEAVVVAYEDAAVEAIVDTVAGLELRAGLRKRIFCERMQ